MAISSNTAEQCKRRRYRTMDGTCNNRDNPEWGSSNEPFLRLIRSNYEDGKYHPQHDLPGARVVSSKIITDKDRPSPLLTVMSVAVGQFLAHDLSFTKPGDKDTFCGSQNCSSRGECLPIRIPRNDPDFKGKPCLRFVRSFGQESCSVRKQQNEVPSYLDASMIYGNSAERAEFLRDGNVNRGKLQITEHPVKHLKGLLPQKYDPDCRKTNASIQCFAGGAIPANEMLGLISLNTIFIRSHNEIEEYLHGINPQWNGETLYQESRRILTAGWQYMVFNEYLPKVLGRYQIEKYNLELAEQDQFWNGYNDKVNPGIINAFATAAMRFGHSQLPDILLFTNELYNKNDKILLSTGLFRPGPLYKFCPKLGSGVDAILRGMVKNRAQTVDMHVTEQVTVHLFAEKPPFGLGEDLVSLNIQRGRDHGIPGYTKFVKLCTGKHIHSFSDLKYISTKNQRKLAYVYKDVEDIDLFVGGLAEEHVEDGSVGPTFACIIGRQLRNLREGDRFWFENENMAHSFTRLQLIEIRKFSLALLICLNGDNIDRIQPDVLIPPLRDVSEDFKERNPRIIRDWYGNGDNERVDCSQLPIPDLTPWTDNGNGDPNFRDRDF